MLFFVVSVVDDSKSYFLGLMFQSQWAFLFFTTESTVFSTKLERNTYMSPFHLSRNSIA